MLRDCGVDTVFGIPGVHTLEFYRGLETSGIRHIQPRHEQGAGFMADGYARASGRPGVCVLISGPGVTNALTAIGQAYTDSVPVLALSSVNERRSLGKGWGRLHEIRDQAAVTRPLTAFSATALLPDDLPDLLRRAMLAMSGRARPVHIEVPLDVLSAPVADPWHPTVAEPSSLPPSPPPSMTDVAQAAAMLAAAKAPLLIVGGGAKGCAEGIRQLAERLGAPVLTTVAGKGVMPAGHPLHWGCLLYLSRVKAMVRGDFDVVLAIGTELAETDTLDADPLRLDGRLIRVDLDDAELYDAHPAALAVKGDAGAFVDLVLPLLPDGGEGHGRTVAAFVEREHALLWDGLNDTQRQHAGVLRAMAAVLPADATIACDMTQIVYSGNMLYPAARPRQWLYPSGFGTLGYALPAAIGAKAARPDSPAVALVGDGGFQFTLPELATAVQEDLPVVVVLWNNGRYGQIHDDMLRRGQEPIGVALRNPDFQQLALAYGFDALVARSEAEMAAHLRTALESGRPTLIEIPAAEFR